MSISLRVFLQKTVRLSNLQNNIAQNLPFFGMSSHNIDLRGYPFDASDRKMLWRRTLEEPLWVVVTCVKWIPPSIYIFMSGLGEDAANRV